LPRHPPPLPFPLHAALPILPTSHSLPHSRLVPRSQPPPTPRGRLLFFQFSRDASLRAERGCETALRSKTRVAAKQLLQSQERPRSEEHTSGLQSRVDLVCRL